jgi:hypothetical protein
MSRETLERIWKEAVVAKLKVLFRYLSRRTEEEHENISQDVRSLGWHRETEPSAFDGWLCCVTVNLFWFLCLDRCDLDNTNYTTYSLPLNFIALHTTFTVCIFHLFVKIKIKNIIILSCIKELCVRNGYTVCCLEVYTAFLNIFSQFYHRKCWCLLRYFRKCVFIELQCRSALLIYVCNEASTCRVMGYKRNGDWIIITEIRV